MFIEREKRAQSYYKYRRHDRTDYHQTAMERLCTLDPAECKHPFRHLNGTDNDVVKINTSLKLNNSSH